VGRPRLREINITDEFAVAFAWLNSI